MSQHETDRLSDLRELVVDPLSPDTLPLAAAARLLPALRAGKAVSPSTLWRWYAHGLCGVRLAVVRVGGTACTSRQALRQFLAEVEAARRPAASAAVPSQPNAADQASNELAALGI
jgi:hypothetical protein